MIKITKKLVFLLLVACLSSNSFAQTLKVATWLPPSSPQNDIVWPTWAKWVEDATEGRVKVELEYGMGHPKSFFDLVEDNVADVSFTVDGYVPGRFLLSQMAEIPGETYNPEIASVALWHVYKKYFEEANEFEGLKVLAKFVHGPGQMHTNFPVNSLEDLKGKKIRVGGGIVNELAKRLDLTTVGAPAPKVYEMMQQGVVDGVLFPVLEQKYLRLSEVTSHLTVFPEGMFSTSFTIFMNPDVFEGLNDKDQKAIMSVSGEKLSRLAGKAWGDADQIGFNQANAKGVVISRLSADDPRNLALKAISEGMDEDWLDKAASKRGVNTHAALEMYRHLVSQ